jgi:hypothetical protein
VLKISSFVLMLLMSAEDFHASFQLHVDVVEMSFMLISSFVLPMLISSLVLMLMMLQPSCCDVVVVDDAPAFVL